MMPTGKWGRAHFYAPVKKLGPLSINTPLFNMLVVWLAMAFLYVTLYLDVLRRIIRYFEITRLRKLRKRLLNLGT